jgi:hypothetical protein
VYDLGLAEAGDEASLGLQRAVLATEVGAEDVDPTPLPGDGLGVLGLPRVAGGLGVQALYLPALAQVGAAPVPDDGDAVLDLTLVKHRPERELPPVRLQQRLVLDREQPRGLVGVQVEFQPVKSVLRHVPPPRFEHPPYYDTFSQRLQEGPGPQERPRPDHA